MERSPAWARSSSIDASSRAGGEKIFFNGGFYGDSMVVFMVLVVLW